MRDITDKNAKVRKARQQEIIDRTEEIARTLHHAVGRVDDHKFEHILQEVADGKV